MAVFKVTLGTFLKAPVSINICSVILPVTSKRNLHIPCKTTTNRAATWTNSKLPISQTQLTENLKLIQIKPSIIEKQNNEDKPLVVLLEWLLAKNKHIQRFADIYLNHGFDVLSVKLNISQLLWPLKGSQVLAVDLLKTLYNDYSTRPLVIHGLSVGGYLWGEVQVKMMQDLDKYKPLIDNISGAIWDSVVDINETAEGVPAAVFPNNAMLRNACRKYILYRMKKYEQEATQHWRRSRELFYRPIVQCPALLLYSKTDPIGNPNSYNNVKLSYESMGIQIYEKCWDKSPHVAHYRFHREEYVNHVEMFLERIGLLAAVERKRAALM